MIRGTGLWRPGQRGVNVELFLKEAKLGGLGRRQRDTRLPAREPVNKELGCCLDRVSAMSASELRNTGSQDRGGEGAQALMGQRKREIPRTGAGALELEWSPGQPGLYEPAEQLPGCGPGQVWALHVPPL